MIQIAVCDDDLAMCDLLEQKLTALLKRLDEPAHITCYTNALQLAASSLRYDLIFLDIKMPDIDGLALAKTLRESDNPCALIFVTALRDYMPEAFELEAAGYLCKPIDDSRLESALKRAVKRLNADREECLLIQTMNWCKSVKIRDILCCEVINRKIYLHTRNEVIEYYGRIKDLEKRLNGRFIKCHRSYLVNPAWVREYSDGQILLENGSRIPAARARRREFMDAMLQFMKKEE